MFWFKSKTIHVDCFTSRQYVHDFYPIDNTNKFFPDWWKALDKSYPDESGIFPNPTIKSCTGFNQFFNNGITIPLWSDMAVGLTPDNQFAWKFSDSITTANNHNFKQMEGYLHPNEYGHVKIHTPWLIECKEDINWMWVQNTWAFSNPANLIIPPGVVNYKYNTNTDINMFFNFQNYHRNFIIKNGTPMVNIIPMDNRRVKVHVHKLSEEEFMSKRERLIPTSFLNKYGTTKNLINKYEKKCPFGFGE